MPGCGSSCAPRGPRAGARGDRLSRRTRTLPAACALGLICLFGERPVRGAPLGAAIEVEHADGASDCPSSAELTGHIEQILHRSLTSDTGEALRVSVRFLASADGYSAEVHSLGAKPGERTLADRGPSCSALAEAVSVAIALLLDKELGQDPVEAPPPAPAEPAAPAAHVSATVEPAARRTGAPTSYALRASLEGGLALGLVDGSRPLLSEQVGLRLRQGWLFDAGFNAVLPGTTHFGQGELRATLLFASLRGCFTWGKRSLIGPCALLGAGRLRGVGFDYSTVASHDLLWTALGVGGVFEAPVGGRLFCGLAGSLWLPTRRSTFSVENLGIAWKSSLVAGSVSARLGFRIW